MQSAEFNVYNIKKSCPKHTFPPKICDDTTPIQAFLNDADNRKQLNVGSDKQWEQCDSGVRSSLAGDHITNVSQLFPKILDAGINVLIYNGEDDYITNWYGAAAWTTSLEWSGREDFL